MKKEEIIKTLHELAKKQGFYGRLLEEVDYMRSRSEENYQKWLENLESKKFKNAVDLILYFES